MHQRNRNITKYIKTLTIYPFIFIIKIYQYTISPIIGKSCRYYPSCSNYSIQALKKYGIFKGAILSIKRILSCNPWGGHGHDPVP